MIFYVFYPLPKKKIYSSKLYEKFPKWTALVTAKTKLITYRNKVLKIKPLCDNKKLEQNSKRVQCHTIAISCIK